jgi:hypothetical protein
VAKVVAIADIVVLAALVLPADLHRHQEVPYMVTLTLCLARLMRL